MSREPFYPLSRTALVGLLVALATLIALSPAPAQENVSFVVNDVGDESDANPGDGHALTGGGVWFASDLEAGMRNCTLERNFSSEVV